MTDVVAGPVGPNGVATDWPAEAYDVLRARGTSVFCYVPDSGHSRLIEQAHRDAEVIAVPLTCEEEGVAVLAGVHLGGGRGVLLMQSSGVGNCINFLSLVKHGRFPFLAIVTMRGGRGEQNPWQYAMGQATEQVLQAMGVINVAVDAAADVRPSLEAAVDMVDKGGQAVAVLLTQRLLGVKKFE